MIHLNIHNRKKTSQAWFIIFIVVCITTSKNIFAQDISYSQFLSNPIYYNPAYTGHNLGLKARLNQRNQWSKLMNDFSNYSFSLEVAEPGIPGAGGFGLLVQSDMEGLGGVRTNSATFVNSIRVPISSNIVSQMGTSIAFVQKSIDWQSLTFSDQIDPALGIIRDSNFSSPDFDHVSYPDFGFGLMLKYFETTESVKNIVGTISFAMHHAFRPDVSFTGQETRLPYRFVFMGDLLLDNETGNYSSSTKNSFFFKLKPGFLFEKQADMTNFVFGTNAYKNFIYAGLWIRSQNFSYTTINDFISLIGLHVPIGESSRIKFMYSYDFIISGMRSAVGSSHEFSVVFELDGFSFSGTDAKDQRRRGWGRMNYGIPEPPAF